MRRSIPNVLPWIVVALVLIGSAAILVREKMRIERRLAELNFGVAQLMALERIRQGENEMQIAIWMSGGVTHQVITYRDEGESTPDFNARHDAAVAAARAQFPPD